MKKIVSVMLAGVLLCGALNAQSIKVTNTFGGDSDNISGSDLFVFENHQDFDLFQQVTKLYLRLNL